MNQVVIWSSGLGGLYCARALRFAPVEVTVVIPKVGIVWEMAAGHSAELPAAGVKQLLHSQRNARVLAQDPIFINAKVNRLLFANHTLPYDFLVIDTGMETGVADVGNTGTNRRASGLTDLLARSLTPPVTPQGQIWVSPWFHLPERPDVANVFLLGNLVRVALKDVLPADSTSLYGGTSRQGRYIASAIRNRFSVLETLPFQVAYWPTWLTPLRPKWLRIFHLSGGVNGFPTFIKILQGKWTERTSAAKMATAPVFDAPRTGHNMLGK